MPTNTAPPTLPPRSARTPVFPRSGAAWALFGYVGFVTLLIGVSFLTQDSTGPALYLLAAGLTLPTGLAIYPALWVNAWLADATHELLGFSGNAAGAVQVAGVFVVFAVAALLNGALASYSWRSIRADIKAQSIRRDDRSRQAGIDG
jgi:hypothetical protein